MDFKKIFIKDACPTKIGGQAVLEGIMMKGEERTAVVVRDSAGRLYIKTELLPERSKAAEIPIVRGVYIFVTTLMTGMKTLIYSAEILEQLEGEAAEAVQDDTAAQDDAAEAVQDADQSDTDQSDTDQPETVQTDIQIVCTEQTSTEPPDPVALQETTQQEIVQTDTGQTDILKISTEQPNTAKAAEKTDEKKKEEGGLPFGVMIAFSVAIAIAFVVGIFIIVPTVAVNFLGAYTDSAVALNLFEGVLRIIFFVVYIVIVSRMKEIQTTFEYHGAEHKTIHCFENGLPLTPANASGFETLHPRCGTSFLMFVMIIALLLFSLLGWPDLAMRILSRIVFIPLIAGLSFELLRYAGRTDNALVKILSVPGLLLQKLTTRNPDDSQLELAIAALKAVVVPAETPVIEGFCDNDGELLDEEDEQEFESAQEGQWV